LFRRKREGGGSTHLVCFSRPPRGQVELGPAGRHPGPALRSTARLFRLFRSVTCVALRSRQINGPCDGGPPKPPAAAGKRRLPFAATEGLDQHWRRAAEPNAGTAEAGAGTASKGRVQRAGSGRLQGRVLGHLLLDATNVLLAVRSKEANGLSLGRAVRVGVVQEVLHAHENVLERHGRVPVLVSV